MTEERRLVTVLFADVTGSTALGESLDPEDLRALMAGYFTVAREVVTTHGGTLEKFIGDAVMAVFGLPVAHGDDAVRALDAALELRERLRADPVLGERLPVRLGVNTGEVVASVDAQARGDFLITGDAVNVAARLQQGAEPWEIVVGERTARAAGDRFTFTPLDMVPARGRSVAVAAAVLTGRSGQAMRPRTRLVGRADDLDQLELVARRAFRERRPYLVSIIAPPGAGKSRLLEEFVDRLDRTGTGATIATAQCLPYGQRLTYWPMRALLLRLISLAEDAGPDEVRRETRRWLDSLDDPDAGRHAELLAATVGAAELDATDRESVFEAWREAIELAAARGPLVLVVEDLHWSSETLLDLVESVLQPRADVPLLMIALTRPELLDRRPSWGGGKRNYVSLALEPLDNSSLEELVADLLEAPAPEIVRAVVSRSDGNPFYAGEIVRSIVQQVSDLRDHASVARVVAALPETVQATVLARLDLLEPAARRLLQCASVFGRSFRVPGIHALDSSMFDRGDGPGIPVEDALDDLVARDLVRASGVDAYTFRHILIREVAYGTLTRAERARLHHAAAAWLEGTAGSHADALAELIAYHYREAATLGSVLEASPPLALRAVAVRWLCRAAEIAMAGAAQLEAVHHIESAIELAVDADMPALYERLGDMYVGGPEALEAYEKALELGRLRGWPPDDQLRLIANELTVTTRWHGTMQRGVDERIRKLAAEGEQLLGAATDDRGRARFLIARSYVAADGKDHAEDPVDVATRERARRSAFEGIEIARRLDDVKLISAGLDGVSSVAVADDDYRASLEVVAERLQLGERLDFVEQLDARMMVAWHRMSLGEFEASLDSTRDALARIGPGQAPSFRLGLLAWRIANLHALGRWDEAATEYSAFDLGWEELGRPAAGHASHGFLAAYEIGRARRDPRLADSARTAFLSLAARAEAGTRLPWLMAVIDRDLEAIERDVLARFRVFAGRIDHLDRPLAVCTDRGYHPAPALLRAILEHVERRGIRLVAAQVRRAIGEAEEDSAELARALEEFDAIGARPYAARVCTELGRLTGDDGLMQRGMAELEALGDVDQLERVVRRATS